MLQDGLLISLSDCDLLKIKYDVKTCYARYKRSGERHTSMKHFRKREVTTECPLASPTSRQQRAKTEDNSSLKEKPCIICDRIKCQDDTKKFRICEE